MSLEGLVPTYVLLLICVICILIAWPCIICTLLPREGPSLGDGATHRSTMHGFFVTLHYLDMPVMLTMSASGHVHVLELYTCLFIALEGMRLHACLH